MSHQRSALFVALALTLLACGDDAATPEESTEPARATRVEVHEWGLVAHHYRDQGSSLASVVSGGARYAHASELGTLRHAAGGKPVLYVQVEGGEASLSVRVRAPGGSILEHLPTATLENDASSVVWNALGVAPGSCATTEHLAVQDPRCQTRDQYCEALENASFDTNDSSCLTMPDGSRANHLFYRAEVAISGLPLVVTLHDPSGPGWDARNAGSAPIPGKLMVVWRSPGDTPPKVALVDPPAPGATIALPIDAEYVERRRADTLLRESLVATGITEREANAFLAAWATSFFGSVPRPSVPPTGGSPPAALRQTLIALYYIAPDAVLGRVLPLEVTPAPDRIARAILVKVDLFDPPEGTIGLGTLDTIGHGGLGSLADPPE